MRIGCLLVVIMLCFNAGVDSIFVNPVYTARLESTQVVGSNGPEEAVGVAVCEYTRYSDPATMYCALQNNYILTQTSVVQMAIYFGPRGFNGQMLYEFDQDLFTLNYNEIEIQLDTIGNYTVEQQIFDFLSGNWYIQINVELPDYSIRGQLEHTDRFFTIMDSSQTIPPSGNTNTFGIGLSVYTVNQPRRTLQMEILHNVENPTAIEYRIETEGNYGTFAFSLSKYRSPIFESVQVTVEEQEALISDHVYAQVNSPNYQNGEIRGHVYPIDLLQTPKFTSRLNGNQAIPTVNTAARGCGLFSYNCHTSTLEYIVYHTVTQPTTASVFFGAEGQIGSVVFSLPTAISPIYGSIVLSEVQALRLFNESFYVLVQSAQFPTGEIRGQISTTFGYYSYLSGINSNPPITTAAVGCATYRLIGDVVTKLDFDIEYNTAFPQSVFLMEGAHDVNGPLNRVLSNTPINTAIGDGELMSTRDVTLFTTGRLYVQVNTMGFPSSGELRGQILPIDPFRCDGSVNNGTTFTLIFPPPPNLPPRNDSGLLLPGICVLVVVFLSALML